MTFSISPAVNIKEFDLTGIVPAATSSEAAIGGVFRWGPVDQRSLVDSEDILKNRYGPPSNHNPETWFTSASFLGYSNRLYVSRAADITGNNHTLSYDGNTSAPAIANATAILKLTGNTSLANIDGSGTGLSAGMVLFYSNNSALPVGAKISSVNSTAVVLNADATANVEDVQVIFRDDIVYSAVALQSDLNYTAVDVGDWDGQIIKNEDHYTARISNGDTWDSAVLYVGRYPGKMGNSLRVAVCDTSTQYTRTLSATPNAQLNSTASGLYGNVGSNTLSLVITPADTANATESATANALAGTLHGYLTVGDLLRVGSGRLGWQYLQVTALGAVTNTANVYSVSISVDDEYKLGANVRMTSVKRYWEFYNSVDVTPGQSDYVLSYGNTSANDELHVVVVDEGGEFSGSPGTILEVYRNLSRATDAKSSDGATVYYKDVINQRSQYIWCVNDRTTAVSNTATYVRSSTGTEPLNMRMIGGADGLDEEDVTVATLNYAYDLFASAEDVDVSLILQGKARGEGVSHYTQLGNYIIDNICTTRLDCIAFISPDKADVVNNIGEEVDDVIDFRNSLRSTSYAVLDSGYKYMYDKYNDVYRWIPLNGDIAGLCARTDRTNDPWWSPAGHNRGHIKNSIRLAWNPRKAQRDSLYQSGINPVVTFKGQGTILYGDKTLLSKPSAFDRINVRRLFIALEKSIATAAQYTLFEFNDAFTRAQFKNLITPFLRDVQGRRGIMDFAVVCDDSNNTAEVIDRNEFIGDIYIKPARSINFINLNFVAVRTGVSFSEVIGRFGG